MQKCNLDPTTVNPEFKDAVSVKLIATFKFF